MRKIPCFRLHLRALLATLGPAVVALPLDAQELATNCDPIEWRVWDSQLVGPERVHWIGGPVLICSDGTRIRADSAVVYDNQARTQMIGRVQITHPERTLRAAYADYFEREGRLYARGSVEFRDLVQGSELYGDTLNLLEAGRNRVEQEVRAVGRPAIAVLPPRESDAPADSAEASSYRVSASQIRIVGERFFWGDGNAEVVRDSLFASADSLAFDQESGQLRLDGAARVVRGELEMEAPEISLVLPNDELRFVELFGGGRIRTPEMEVVGDEIRLDVDNEQIQRLVTVRRVRSEADADRPRPHVLAEEVYVTADSVDVLSPGEVLQSLTATGRARLETRGNDTAQADSAAVDPDVSDPGLPVEDWMEAEVIVATFIADDAASAVVAPVPMPDTTAADPSAGAAPPPDPAPAIPEAAPEGDDPGYVLDRLTATGNAKSWYRSPPEGVDPESSNRRWWGVDYILADEITVQLSGGAVDWIEAIGSVRGMRIEPEEVSSPSDPAVTEDRE
ncbi:MAG: hypothetical protein WEG36_16215 [Gemmatimonadota bacterium]